MNPDIGIFIGLIVTLSGVGMLGLSYMGAYMLGRTRARREMELERAAGQDHSFQLMDHDRVLMMESAMASMAQAIERLSDAQRVALLERMRAANEPPRAIGRSSQHNTPA